jgi:hypothetical protein
MTENLANYLGIAQDCLVIITACAVICTCKYPFTQKGKDQARIAEALEEIAKSKSRLVNNKPWD